MSGVRRVAAWYGECKVCDSASMYFGMRYEAEEWVEKHTCDVSYSPQKRTE